MQHETWKKIAGWSYIVSDQGHVRKTVTRNRGNPRFLDFTTDTKGRQYVILKKADKETTYPVDLLVCTAFHGKPRYKEFVVEHSDGVLWNNWRSNLRWSFPMNAVKWYAGSIEHARRGYYRLGPFASKLQISRLTKPGDVLIGLDKNNKVVGFEFNFGFLGTRNPYDGVRYFRATARHIAYIEKQKGADVVLHKDPHAAAEEYRKYAEMHPEFMWAHILMEAAAYIEAMANMIGKDITLPEPVVVQPLPRRGLRLTPPPALPKPVRRQLNIAAPTGFFK